MIVGIVKIKLYAPWVHSLKEKRMIIRSICAKLKNKFNISVIEAEMQDIHQTIIIGIACLANTVAIADSTIENVITFIEENCEAQILDIERDVR